MKMRREPKRYRMPWATAGSRRGLAGPAGETMDFAACVDAALKQNPGLSASRAQISQAEAGLAQARGGRLPKVTVSLNGVRTDDALKRFRPQAGATQRDFRGFRRREFDPSDPNVLSVASAPTSSRSRTSPARQ